MDSICKKCQNNKPGEEGIIMSTRDSNGVVTPWVGLGDQCKLVNCSMFNVKSCSRFDEIGKGS